MTSFLYLAALFLLVTVAVSLVRIYIGPSRAERMMSAQLAGTSGVGVILLLASVEQNAAIIDVALVLALLAAFAAIAFVKATTPDGAGDPEEGDG